MSAQAVAKRREDSGSDPFKDEMVALIPSLRAFTRGLCGNREMGDDLAQDAMMRAWAARDSYTPGTNFRAWMFMIARNQFYTTVKRNARMVSWDPEVAERVLVMNETQEHSINLADVERALAKLPAGQREVLMLVGAGGVSYEEAAEIIGCAIGTIKSRMARGRATLSALINGEDPKDVAAETAVTRRSRPTSESS